MAIIKYYDLESRSWAVVNGLTANLMKHMLSEKSIKGLLTTSIEDIADAEGKTAEPKEELLYDSGEFDVLYRNSRIIKKKKWRIFGKSIPEEIGTEFVVKASPLDIISLQNYIGDSGFDVLEARTVTKATLYFATILCHPDTNAIFKTHIEEMVTKENRGLEARFSVSKNVYRDGINGDSCKGTLHGDAEQILRFRKIIISMAEIYGADIARDQVNFFY